MRLIFDSKTAQRVDIVIPAGAELEVPDVVAADLAAISTHFRRADGEPVEPLVDVDGRRHEGRKEPDPAGGPEPVVKPEDPKAPAAASETIDDVPGDDHSDRVATAAETVPDTPRRKRSR